MRSYSFFLRYNNNKMSGTTAANGHTTKIGSSNGYTNGNNKNIMDTEMDKAQQFLSKVSEMLITKGFKQSVDATKTYVVVLPRIKSYFRQLTCMYK